MPTWLRREKATSRWPMQLTVHKRLIAPRDGLDRTSWPAAVNDELSESLTAELVMSGYEGHGKEIGGQRAFASWEYATAV
jgi:hypothetical protein